MRRRAERAILLALLAAGCDNPAGPDPLPPDRFGAVTAVIDGREWVSSYFPDSTVGFYDPGTGHLQITGQQFRRDGFPLTLHLIIEADASPGAYAFTPLSGAVVGQWFVPEYTERPRDETGIRGYVSTGAVGDSLVIEALDVGTRVVRGRFSFVARLIRSAREVRLAGRFAGKVLVRN